MARIVKDLYHSADGEFMTHDQGPHNRRKAPREGGLGWSQLFLGPLQAVVRISAGSTLASNSVKLQRHCGGIDGGCALGRGAAGYGHRDRAGVDAKEAAARQLTSAFETEWRWKSRLAVDSGSTTWPAFSA